MSFTSLPGGSPRETDERRRVDALSADEVAAWLQRNPEFFESHRDMLSQLKLRHPHGGRAISLIERQVTALRDANRMLEKRLADFLRIGRENDALSMKMQAEVNLPEASQGPVSASLQQWADRLEQPYCGPATQDEILGWFPERGQEVASMAAMALRAGNEIRSFGLLVIGSHDPNRFQAGMGTVVLEQLADMAGASLSRALPPKESA